MLFNENQTDMKNSLIGLSLFTAMAMSACGHGKTDQTSTGDTTSMSKAVNSANGAAGLHDSAGRKAAGDTTAAGHLTKKGSADSLSKQVK